MYRHILDTILLVEGIFSTLLGLIVLISFITDSFTTDLFIFALISFIMGILLLIYSARRAIKK